MIVWKFKGGEPTTWLGKMIEVVNQIRKENIFTEHLLWGVWKFKKVEVLVAQSCQTPCSPMDSSLPGSSVHGILQARVLEWVTTPFPRGSSWPRNWTWVSCIAGRFFTIWFTREYTECMNVWLVSWIPRSGNLHQLMRTPSLTFSASS